MKTGLKRSQFTTGIAATAATIGVIRAPARAAEFQWKCAMNPPPGHPFCVRIVQAISAIKAESKGRVEIAFFPNSSLGNDTQMISQVRSGAIQLHPQFDGALTAIAPIAGINAIGF